MPKIVDDINKVLAARKDEIDAFKANDPTTKVRAELTRVGITDPIEQANVLAQIEAESALKPRSENLNYSAKRLYQIWGPDQKKNTVRFKTLDDAKAAAAKGEEHIASLIYDNRKDLGNTEAGDGYKFRGRGFIQLTGKDNYKRYGKRIGVDLIANPDLANDPEVAVKLAAEYFADKKKKGVDFKDIAAVTKAVGPADPKAVEKRTQLAQKYITPGAPPGKKSEPPSQVAMAGVLGKPPPVPDFKPAADAITGFLGNAKQAVSSAVPGISADDPRMAALNEQLAREKGIITGAAKDVAGLRTASGIDGLIEKYAPSDQEIFGAAGNAADAISGFLSNVGNTMAGAVNTAPEMPKPYLPQISAPDLKPAADAMSNFLGDTRNAAVGAFGQEKAAPAPALERPEAVTPPVVGAPQSVTPPVVGAPQSVTPQPTRLPEPGDEPMIDRAPQIKLTRKPQERPPTRFDAAQLSAIDAMSDRSWLAGVRDAGVAQSDLVKREQVASMDSLESFNRGFKSGIIDMGVQIDYARAGIANAMGDTDQMAIFMERAKRNEQRMADIVGPTESLKEFFEEPTVDGFFDKVGLTLGQVTPSILGTVATAFATGGTSAVLLAAPQFAGKTVAVGTMKKMVKEAVVKKAKGLALDESEEKLLAGAYQAIRAARGQAFKSGATAGAFATEYPQMTGASFREFSEAGVDLNDPNYGRASLAIGGGLAAIGVFGERLIVEGAYELATKKASRLSSNQNVFALAAKDIAALGLRGAATEGTTEALQEGALVGQRFAVDDDYSAEDAKWRIAEAGFAGALAGGALGGGAGAFTGAARALSVEPPVSTDRLRKEREVISTRTLEGAFGPQRRPRYAGEYEASKGATPQYAEDYKGLLAPNVEAEMKASDYTQADKTRFEDVLNVLDSAYKDIDEGNIDVARQKLTDARTLLDKTGAKKTAQYEQVQRLLRESFASLNQASKAQDPRTAAQKIMDKAKATTQAARDKINEGRMDAEETGMSLDGPTQESEADYNAQIAHLGKTLSPKSGVWIPENSEFQFPDTLKDYEPKKADNVWVVKIPGQGVLLTRYKSDAVKLALSAQENSGGFERMLARVLGYSAVKPDDADRAVAVQDADGNIISEEATNEAGEEAAVLNANKIAKAAGPGASVFVRDLKDALRSRRDRAEAEPNTAPESAQTAPEQEAPDQEVVDEGGMGEGPIVRNMSTNTGQLGEDIPAYVAESEAAVAAVKKARDSVRELLTKLNFKFEETPDLSLSDLERIASKYLTGLHNDDPAFLDDAAKALSYALYTDINESVDVNIPRPVIEKALRSWLEDGKPPKIDRTIWTTIVQWLNKLMSIFSGKEFATIETALEKTITDITTGRDFSFKPKQGFEKLSFQKEMDNNPLAVQVLTSLRKSGIPFSLTGSVAYADQVPVYRKTGSPLHDVDLLFDPKDLDAALKWFSEGDPENWGDVKTMYTFFPGGKKTVGIAAVPAGYEIRNLSSIWNVKANNPQRSYDVYNKETGEKAGSYFFLRGSRETFEGIAGVTIDLLAEGKQTKVPQSFTHNGETITLDVASYVGGFAAKLIMLRPKDVADFKAVVPPERQAPAQEPPAAPSMPTTAPPTDGTVSFPLPASRALKNLPARWKDAKALLPVQWRKALTAAGLSKVDMELVVEPLLKELTDGDNAKKVSKADLEKAMRAVEPTGRVVLASKAGRENAPIWDEWMRFASREGSKELDGVEDSTYGSYYDMSDPLSEYVLDFELAVEDQKVYGDEIGEQDAKRGEAMLPAMKAAAEIPGAKVGDFFTGYKERSYDTYVPALKREEKIRLKMLDNAPEPVTVEHPFGDYKTEPEKGDYEEWLVSDNKLEEGDRHWHTPGVVAHTRAIVYPSAVFMVETQATVIQQMEADRRANGGRVDSESLLQRAKELQAQQDALGEDVLQRIWNVNDIVGGQFGLYDVDGGEGILSPTEKLSAQIYDVKKRVDNIYWDTHDNIDEYLEQPFRGGKPRADKAVRDTTLPMPEWIKGFTQASFMRQVEGALAGGTLKAGMIDPAREAGFETVAARLEQHLKDQEQLDGLLDEAAKVEGFESYSEFKAIKNTYDRLDNELNSARAKLAATGAGITPAAETLWFSDARNSIFLLMNRALDLGKGRVVLTNGESLHRGVRAPRFDVEADNEAGYNTALVEFYDKTLPNIAKKIAKAIGAKIEFTPAETGTAFTEAKDPVTGNWNPGFDPDEFDQGPDEDFDPEFPRGRPRTSFNLKGLMSPGFYTIILTPEAKKALLDRRAQFEDGGKTFTRFMSSDARSDALTTVEADEVADGEVVKDYASAAGQNRELTPEQVKQMLDEAVPDEERRAELTRFEDALSDSAVKYIVKAYADDPDGYYFVDVVINESDEARIQIKRASTGKSASQLSVDEQVAERVDALVKAVAKDARDRKDEKKAAVPGDSFATSIVTTSSKGKRTRPSIAQLIAIGMKINRIEGADALFLGEGMSPQQAVKAGLARAVKELALLGYTFEIDPMPEQKAPADPGSISARAAPQRAAGRSLQLNRADLRPLQQPSSIPQLKDQVVYYDKNRRITYTYADVIATADAQVRQKDRNAGYIKAYTEGRRKRIEERFIREWMNARRANAKRHAAGTLVGDQTAKATELYGDLSAPHDVTPGTPLYDKLRDFVDAKLKVADKEFAQNLRDREIAFDPQDMEGVSDPDSEAEVLRSAMQAYMEENPGEEVVFENQGLAQQREEAAIEDTGPELKGPKRLPPNRVPMDDAQRAAAIQAAETELANLRAEPETPTRNAQIIVQRKLLSALSGTPAQRTAVESEETERQAVYEGAEKDLADRAELLAQMRPAAAAALRDNVDLVRESHIAILDAAARAGALPYMQVFAARRNNGNNTLTLRMAPIPVKDRPADYADKLRALYGALMPEAASRLRNKINFVTNKQLNNFYAIAANDPSRLEINTGEGGIINISRAKWFPGLTTPIMDLQRIIFELAKDPTAKILDGLSVRENPTPNDTLQLVKEVDRLKAALREARAGLSFDMRTEQELELNDIILRLQKDLRKKQDELRVARQLAKKNESGTRTTPKVQTPTRNASFKIHSAIPTIVNRVLTVAHNLVAPNKPVDVFTASDFEAGFQELVDSGFIPADFVPVFQQQLASMRGENGDNIYGALVFRGRYVILLNDLREGSAVDDAVMAIAAAHEMGHILFIEEFGNIEMGAIPENIEKGLLDGYTQFVNEQRANRAEVIPFEEWFSDQVGIYAYREAGGEKQKRSDEKSGVARNKPLTNDRMPADLVAYLKGIAEKLKKLFNAVNKLFGGRLRQSQQFVDYFESVVVRRKKYAAPPTTLIGVAYRNMAQQRMVNGQPQQQLASKLADDAYNLLKDFMKDPINTLKRTVYATDDYLRQMGPAGVELAQFFRGRAQSKEDTGFHSAKTFEQNRWFSKLADAIGIETDKLTDDEIDTILFEAENSTIPTASLTRKAQAVRKVFDDMFEQYITYTDADGNKQKWFAVKKAENYNPRQFNTSAIAQDPKGFADWLVANNFETQKDADAIAAYLAQQAGSIMPAGTGPLDAPMMPHGKARSLNHIPTTALRAAFMPDGSLAPGADPKYGWLVPPQVALTQYIHFTARKVEFERRGGKAKLESLVAQLPKEKQADAIKALEANLGKLGDDIRHRPAARQFNSITQVTTAITTLTFAVFASLSDLAGVAMRSKDFSNFMDVLRQFKRTLTDRENAELARSIGVVTSQALDSVFMSPGEMDYTAPWAKKIMEKFFVFNGTDAYTRFARTFATGMGREFLVNTAFDPEFGPKQERWLSELGVSRDDITSWHASGKPLGDLIPGTRDHRIAEAIARFAEEAVIRPDSSIKPGWASNPYYNVLWQLKTYFYAYGKTIIAGMAREFKNRIDMDGDARGAAAQLALAVGAMLILTMIGLEAREWTKYLLRAFIPWKDSEDALQTDTMDLGEYSGEIINRAGFLGPFTIATSAMEGLQREGWFGPVIASVPAVDFVDDSVFDGDWGRVLPVINNL